MLCYVMLCYVMLCYVMLCYVMLCYVMLCYVMLRYVAYIKAFQLKSTTGYTLSCPLNLLVAQVSSQINLYHRGEKKKKKKKKL